MKIYRQGDVMLVQVEDLPRGCTEAKGQEKKVILARGEATGHHHRIEEPAKAKLWDARAERFLQVMETVALMHEEHLAIQLPPGVYHIAIQQEYHPAELHRVRD